MTREDVIAAVAQGWCTPENAHKTMDEALAMAIVENIMAIPRGYFDLPEPVTLEGVLATILRCYPDDPYARVLTERLAELVKND